jgi:hypothetical protein
MRLASRIAWASALLASTVLARPAPAESCYPLGLGYQWKYRSVHGEHDTETIVGTTTMWGHEVYIKEWSESTWNDGFIWWTSTDSSGAGLLWGYYNSGWPTGGRLYYPPVVLIPGAPAVGDEWSDTTLVKFLPDTTHSEIYVYTRRVYTDEILTLPAGDIQAFGVGWVVLSMDETPEGAILGQRSGREAGEWFAPGIGLVQYASSDLYGLADYNFTVTRTEGVTWGGLKFRWLPGFGARESRHHARPFGSDQKQPIRVP